MTSENQTPAISKYHGISKTETEVDLLAIII